MRPTTLIADSRAALDEGLAAVEGQADIRHAGYLQDAQKEYAEANLTLALVTGTDLPGPTELEVEDAAYLGGMSDAIGEGRRRLLDLLRTGDVDTGRAAPRRDGGDVRGPRDDGLSGRDHDEPAARDRRVPIADREDPG